MGLTSEILIPEIQQWGTCRSAFEKLESLVQLKEPDLKEIYAQMDVLKRNKEGAEMVQIVYTANTDRYNLMQSRLDYILKDKPIAVASENIVKAVPDANGIFMFEGNWHECVTQMKENNLEMLTARQLAELRMKFDKGNRYTEHGFWVSEAMVCMPNGDLFIIPGSYNLLFKFSAEASERYKNNNPFLLKGIYQVMERNLEYSRKKGKSDVKEGILYIQKRDIPNKIHVNEFGNNIITSFLFGDSASKYGNWLGRWEFDPVYFYTPSEEYISKQKEAFIMPFWFGFAISKWTAFGNNGNYNPQYISADNWDWIIGVRKP